VEVVVQALALIILINIGRKYITEGEDGQEKVTK
jgi:hypothetical protein